VAVATKGHLTLYYRPALRDGPAVQGAHSVADVILVIHTVVPACFQHYKPNDPPLHIHRFASSSQ
jgi:hypothetical protein